MLVMRIQCQLSNSGAHFYILFFNYLILLLRLDRCCARRHNPPSQELQLQLQLQQIALTEKMM
jgi:hypothetical protein